MTIHRRARSHRRSAGAAVCAILWAACAGAHAQSDNAPEDDKAFNQETFASAATAPLRDVNLVRPKIPDILLVAMADPYARPPETGGCAAIETEVQTLDGALGPDLDALLIAAEDERLLSRDNAFSLARDAVRGVTTDLIPMRSWVRRLSGAEQHDRMIRSALAAGNVRRAYLKGLGEARGCLPPGTPSHLSEPAKPVKVKAWGLSMR